MATQLPGPLRLVSSWPFVGRSRELAVLEGLLPGAQGDGCRIALIGGEAGSGKSRLVREFAQVAAGQGGLVLYGACDPVVRTPFGPFVEALGQLARTTASERLRDDLGPAGGELVRLLPDLALAVGELPVPVETDPDTVRHRLHTAVSDLLCNVGERQPLLLVLEDCHWADEPTLLLLRHLARTSAAARMLVLTTFRDTEAEVPAQLADTLADLRRSDAAVRLKLGQLDEAHVAEFVRRFAGDRVLADPALVTGVHELTRGNAFLLCELARTLLHTGSITVASGTVRLTRPLGDIATPDSIREVVGQRLSRLTPEVRRLVELATVMGHEFEVDVLRSAATTDLDLAAALESAVHSGIIEEVPAPRLSYRFTHELVRRALYDQLSGLRRAELHLRVGETLAAERPRTGQLLAGLAYHHTAAVPVAGRERAVEYNLLAAEAAAASLAFGEAVARLRTALHLGIEDDARRAEAQIALGTALTLAGTDLDSLAPLRGAAEIARELDRGDLLARAAIAFELACERPGLPDQGALAMLKEASDLLPAEDSPLRVRLLASLTRALHRLHGDNAGSSAAVLRSGVAMARRLDDRAGLARVLASAYWSDLGRREVLDMEREALDLAAELGDVDLEAEAMEWRVAALMQMGEIEAAERELAVVHTKAARTRQPFILHVAEHHGSALALLTGRLAEAEAAAHRSHEWGRLLTGRDASGVYGIQMFGVLRELGRLGTFAPAVRVLAARGAAWRPGLAALLAEIGLDGEARAELALIRRGGLEASRQSLWLASLTYLADAASAAADPMMAALVYPELAPLSGGSVVIGHGIACYGAADRYLGMLAATLGELEAAVEHFEVALALNRAMGARTWLAHTAYEYGRMLLGGGDGERARPLLAEAAAIAGSVGMPALHGRVVALNAVGPAPERRPDDLSGRELDVLRLLVRGLSNRQIGAALHISEHTAANHVRAILGKTGSANRTEAAAYAFRRGLASSAWSG